MQTPHEAAVDRLKTLIRANHPELEQVLALVGHYPVAVQVACEAAIKRGDDPAILLPVKAVADQQAVEIQELLDALTTALPIRTDLQRAAEPSLADRQAAPQSPFLPGTSDDAAWLETQRRAGWIDPNRRIFGTAADPLDPTQPAGPVSPTLPKHPGDPDPNLPDGSPAFLVEDRGTPFTHSGSVPDPQSGRSGLDTSQAAAPFVDPALPVVPLRKGEPLPGGIPVFGVEAETAVMAAKAAHPALFPHEVAVGSEPLGVGNLDEALAAERATGGTAIDPTDKPATEAADPTPAWWESSSPGEPETAPMVPHTITS